MRNCFKGMTYVKFLLFNEKKARKTGVKALAQCLAAAGRKHCP